MRCSTRSSSSAATRPPSAAAGPDGFVDIALTSAALAARDPVARGEAAFRAARRMRRRATLVACVVLFCCILLAGWVSQVEPTTLADGIPRIGEYVWRTLPTLRRDVLFASWETDGSLAAW